MLTNSNIQLRNSSNIAENSLESLELEETELEELV